MTDVRHAAVAMRVCGLSRSEAEGFAYENTIVDCLNATHPNRCAHCGKLDLPLTPILPFGVGDRHTWLHQRCRDPWVEGRRKTGIEMLAAIGIAEPSKDEALQ